MMYSAAIVPMAARVGAIGANRMLAGVSSQRRDDQIILPAETLVASTNGANRP